MPTSIAAETILLDLDTHTTQRLLLEPALSYDSLIQRSLGLFHFEFGKDKLRMLHLSKPSNMLQPRSNCDTWNPTIRMQLRPDEIGVSDFEVNGQQCPDEFDVGCLRNLRGDRPADFPNYGPELNALEQAMVRQTRAGLTDDIYKVSYFGNLEIRDMLASGEINLDHLSPDQKENFLVQMEVCSGWWDEIMSRSYSSDPHQKIRYVDSNDGTVSGNATNPANVVPFLRQLRMSSSQILKNWNRNRSRNDWPVYAVQSGIFNALRQYYQSLNYEAVYSIIVDGEPVTGMLTLDGYVVAEIPEWDMYDAETGNMDETTGFSKKQRAIFTAKENLTGLTNVRSLDVAPGSGLVIQQSPLLRDKGKKYMYYAFGMGFGVAQPQLMTASWNSSDTYQ